MDLGFVRLRSRKPRGLAGLLTGREYAAGAFVMRLAGDTIPLRGGCLGSLPRGPQTAPVSRQSDGFVFQLRASCVESLRCHRPECMGYSDGVGEAESRGPSQPLWTETDAR